MDATRSAIDLDRVGKRFAGGTLALAGVSLSVTSGSFVAILGPSGCGKSTLLRMIAGLDTPSEGSIRLAGGQRGGDRGVSFVFQEPTLMPWGTVFENVWLPLRLAGRSRAAARDEVEALIGAVGLAGFADALPRELSGGMKMRVSIARALAPHPGLLLMDEPFAALDEITRNRLNDDLLHWWRERGLTALFVTHSVFEAVYLSERIAVMSPRPGRLVAEVAIDEPYPRTEAFRSSPRYARLCSAVSKALRDAQQREAD